MFSTQFKTVKGIVEIGVGTERITITDETGKVDFVKRSTIPPNMEFLEEALERIVFHAEQREINGSFPYHVTFWGFETFFCATMTAQTDPPHHEDILNWEKEVSKGYAKTSTGHAYIVTNFCRLAE